MNLLHVETCCQGRNLLPTDSIVSPFLQEPQKYCHCHNLTGTQLSSGIDTIVYVCRCHQGFVTWHQLKDEEAKMEAQRSCARQGQGISGMARKGTPDLVLAKVRGFSAWPAKVRQPIFHPHLFSLI